MSSVSVRGRAEGGEGGVLHASPSRKSMASKGGSEMSRSRLESVLPTLHSSAYFKQCVVVEFIFFVWWF
jgi:hypothetical protein